MDFLISVISMVRELKRSWSHLDLTVREGLAELGGICAMELSIKGGGTCLRLPDQSEQGKALLGALKVITAGRLSHVEGQGRHEEKALTTQTLNLITTG
jgi:hypothetical protein